MLSPPELSTENAQLRHQVEVKNQRIQHLEELVMSLRHKQFGASSEKLTADQVQLFNEAEGDALSEADEQVDSNCVDVPAHTRKKKRTSIPADLPRQEIVHDLPESEKTCPHDGTALKHIGDECSEQLDIIPAKITVLRHVRRKYACPCCEQHIVTARKPAQPIEKSIAAPGLLAHVAIGKYCDGLPLYRQIAMFKRVGVELDRTTLANWMIKLGGLAQPLINRLQESCTEQSVLHMDETPLQVLNEPGRDAQTKSYMWVMTTGQSSESAVIYRYSARRNGETPANLLQDFSGALMTDGYVCYNAICHDNQLTALGCWAHARRYFMDAKKAQVAGKAGKADQALTAVP